MSLYILILLKAPSIFPNFNFPGIRLIIRIIGVIMGLFVLYLVYKFLDAVKDAPDALRAGNGGEIGLRIGAVFLSIAILFAGTAFLFSWVGFFHIGR